MQRKSPPPLFRGAEFPPHTSSAGRGAGAFCGPQGLSSSQAEARHRSGNRNGDGHFSKRLSVPGSVRGRLKEARRTVSDLIRALEPTDGPEVLDGAAWGLVHDLAPPFAPH